MKVPKGQIKENYPNLLEQNFPFLVELNWKRHYNNAYMKKTIIKKSMKNVIGKCQDKLKHGWETMFPGLFSLPKQFFLVCPPSENMARKQCFLVCPRNMGGKRCFLVCSPCRNNVPWFVHLQETWLGNNVSWFVYLQETWLRNNVFWFVYLQRTWLRNNVSWFVHLQKT